MNATIIAATGTCLLLLLPPLGILVSGRDIRPYLHFPPLTLYVDHAGFSWPAFILIGLFILLMLAAPVRCAFAPKTASAPAGRGKGKTPGPRGPRPDGPGAVPLLPDSGAVSARFPAWGWSGVALVAVGWVLAWTRFPRFAALQPYTFLPLWIAYVVTVNALTHLRSGRCMMTRETARFLLLFPLSAAFWWFFEFLNRFVQNWHYVGIAGFSPARYIFFATLHFSTVLPAVLGTCELLFTFPGLARLLESGPPIRLRRPRAAAWAVLLLSGVGLAGIGVWPDWLFPLTWVSPLCIVASMQVLGRRRTLFAGLEAGNWNRVVLLAASALICGWFWEMWNSCSLAKWVYAIPFVDRFHIFEMPLLGYAGYLPFGLECAMVADWAGIRPPSTSIPVSPFPFQQHHVHHPRINSFPARITSLISAAHQTGCALQSLMWSH